MKRPTLRLRAFWMILSILSVAPAGCGDPGTGDETPSVTPGTGTPTDNQDGTPSSSPDSSPSPLPSYPPNEPSPTPAVDNDQDGSPAELDCDDADPGKYPSAAEVCDGIDNNCDGLSDEGITTHWYVDADGDGFGAATGAILACTPPPGYVASGGDCNESDPTVYPGAGDPAGDGIDQDCGGADGAQPSVGLTSSAYQSIQAALDASIPGQTVWVGPGTYHEFAITFKGKAVTLQSTDGPTATLIDGEGKGRLVDFVTQETSGSVLRGFTLTGGYEQSGGGLYISSSPVLEDLIVVGNAAGGSGGAFYIEAGAPVIRSCLVQGNRAEGNQGGGIIILGGSAPAFDRVVLLRNSAVYQGGGLYAGTAYPAITGCSFIQNESEQHLGGGIYLDHTVGTISGTLFRENVAAISGGGIYMVKAAVSLSECVLEGNRSGSVGGGIYMENSKIPMVGLTFKGNSANSIAGALYVRTSQAGSEPTLTDCLFQENQADQYAGAMLLDGGEPSLSGCDFRANAAPHGFGGALYLEGSSPTIAHTEVTGNTAGKDGGGVYVEAGSPGFSYCTLAGNRSGRNGGGMYLYGSGATPTVRNSILAYNIGYNLFNDPLYPVTPTVTGNDLYSRLGPNHNLNGIDASNRSVAPGFVSFSNGDFPLEDDFHLTPGSSLIDSGDPDVLDPDGSVADPGAYGGPGADGIYYLDADGDGLYDGWERLHGLDPAAGDGEGDPDADGASNLEELRLGSDPQVADGDGDGFLDGEEAAAGSDPVDWYSQPGADEVAIAQVPGDFPSLQAAIAALRWQGAIVVAPGIQAGNLSLIGRSASISGSSALDTVLTGVEGPVISGLWAHLELDHLAVTGGNGTYGGGLYLRQVDGAFRNVQVRDNHVKLSGGGLYLAYSSIAFTDCLIEDNSANQGGGLYVWYSSPVLSNCLLRDNQASLSGGGLYLWYSTPGLAQCALQNNRADQGGGMYVYFSSPVIENSVMTGNAGNGLELFGASARPSLEASILAYNGGYNLYNDSSAAGSPSLSYCDLYSNGAENNHNLNALDGSNKTVEPAFLAYGAEGVPTDLHLALGSPLIDAASPTSRDSDGSRGDVGIYGGSSGAQWDLDADGKNAWFWPGQLTDAPEGFRSADWDCDDLSGATSSCS